MTDMAQKKQYLRIVLTDHWHDPPKDKTFLFDNPTDYLRKVMRIMKSVGPEDAVKERTVTEIHIAKINQTTLDL